MRISAIVPAIVGSVLAISLSVAPAAAERWVQVDPYIWVDADSIGAAGSLTIYRVAHSSAANTSPAAASGSLVSWSGMDCATGARYWQRPDGSWEPATRAGDDMIDPNGDPYDPDNYRQTPEIRPSTDPLRKFVCRQ